MSTPVSSYYNGGSSTPSTMTITGINSLVTAATESLGLISNINGSFEGAMIIRVYYKIVLGSAPSANNTLTFYLLQGDNSSNATDGATTSAGAITILTASILALITTTTATTYQGSFIIRNPGPQWGIALNNASGQTTASSGQSITYVTESIST